MLIGGERGFEIYIGNSPDYTQNTLCSGGPWLVNSAIQTGNAHWSWDGGFEAWCELTGAYVSLMRDPDAATIEPDVRICHVGFLSDNARIGDVPEIEEVEEVEVPEEVDTDLFEEAQLLFKTQFPQFLIILEEETTIVELGFIADPLYSYLSLVADFGHASGFCEFDPSTGTITLEPNIGSEGTYELQLTLTDGSK